MSMYCAMAKRFATDTGFNVSLFSDGYKLDEEWGKNAFMGLYTHPCFHVRV